MRRTMLGALAVVLIAGGLLALVTAATLYRRARPAGRGGSSSDGQVFVDKTEDWREVKWIKRFTLTERSGRQFRSEELDGKVWVVSFFFTSCPSTCRDQNAHIERLHRKWGPKGVTFVSITCDPDTDTPARLREYAHTFNADPQQWLFLTGELLQVRRIAAEVFGVYVDKAVHMDRLTLIDRWGKVRGHFNWHKPEQLAEMEAAMEKLLAETEPPGGQPDRPADAGATEQAGGAGQGPASGAHGDADA